MCFLKPYHAFSAVTRISFRGTVRVMEKPQAFVFFGRSGSGKGTQVALLKEYFESAGKRTFHIDNGSTFRKLKDSGSFTGKLLGKTMDAGELVPEAFAIWSWLHVLIEKFTGNEVLIFEGTRKLGEFKDLEEVFGFYGIEKPMVILIDTSEAWSMERMADRGRSDDGKAKERLAYFQNEVMQTVDYARSNPNFHFVEVNGEQTIEAVHADILEALKLSY